MARKIEPDANELLQPLILPPLNNDSVDISDREISDYGSINEVIKHYKQMGVPSIVITFKSQGKIESLRVYYGLTTLRSNP